MPWVAECGHTISESFEKWLEEQGDKSKAYVCETCGQPTIRYEPTPEEEAKVGDWLEAGLVEEGKLAKQGETSMEWFVFGKEVLCQKCAGKVKGAKPLKLASLEGVELECAKCGMRPMDIKKGAIVEFGSKQKIYCPDCAKKHEGLILAKANSVISLEEDDIVPTPLWCDECGKPIPVAVPAEVATVLHKTIEGLEAIIFEKKLRESRPALWQKALQWKEKLDNYLLAVQLPEPEPKADSLHRAIDELKEIIFDAELKKSRPDLWKRAVELKEILESEIRRERHPRNL
jgi:protein-arginine kinase activator protein McsA